ncbi:MAG TPA: NAD-dependent epimerase/dehydratase family protein [Gemmatimonadales bacterium]|nr:NAD-dependent epimerase/dehydratase family protein [Gemmatimonadales bacterium]
MRLLVTGADGFVGRTLTHAARAAGHDVVATIGPGGAEPAAWLPAALQAGVTTRTADLTSATDVARLGAERVDAVVHLAAISSGADARRDPAAAMAVNTEATARLFDAVTAGGRAPRFLFVSTAEVYGPGHAGPIVEDAPIAPISPYAESKAAAEALLFDAAASTGVPLVVARPFPHTGPGQDTRFVLPAFAARLRAARQAGDRTFAVGTLDVVRDFLDVRDVVAAYLALLAQGAPMTAYNIATGVGRHLGDCVQALRALVGCDAEPVTDASLVRPADIPVLIGDPARLMAATGWAPSIPFDQTLKDLVDAQAD